MSHRDAAFSSGLRFVDNTVVLYMRLAWHKMKPTSIQRFVKPTSAIFDFAYSIRIAPRSEERRKDPWRVAIAWAA